MKKLITCACVAGVGLSLLFAETKNKADVKDTSKANNAKKTFPSTKIGTVSSQKMMNEYYRVKELNERLSGDFNAAQKELISMISDYEKITKEYQELEGKVNNPALTEEGKKKAKAEAEAKLSVLQQKENAINDFKTNSEQRIAQMRMEEGAKLATTVKQRISETAQSMGLTMVIDADNPGIFYANAGMDITTKVLEKLNADQGKKVAPVNTAAKTSKK